MNHGESKKLGNRQTGPFLIRAIGNRRREIFLFIYLWLLSGAGIAHALEPIDLSREMNGELIGKYVEHLEDGSKKLTIDDVSKPEFADKFVPIKQENISFGMSFSAHWVRFKVINPSEKELDWILEAVHPTLNHIEVYDFKTASEYTIHEGGNYIPFGKREINYRKNAFKIQSSPGVSFIYVKFWPETSALMLCTLQIYTPVMYFYEKIMPENLAFGIFYGAMTVMFFYNLFIYLSLRDRSYLYYIIYVALTMVMYLGLNGIGFQYIWPNSVYMDNTGRLALVCLALIAQLSFTKTFLKLKSYSSQADMVLSVVSAGFWVVIVVMLLSNSFTPFVKIGYPLTFIVPYVLFIAGGICFVKGYRPARFYLAAWALYLVGAALYISRDYGVVQYSIFTTYAMQSGTLAEVILLSFALADRINILQSEKILTQQRLMEEERRALEIAKTAQETLEIKVAERTRELSASREEAENATRLKDKFVSLVTHDLKSPLSSLALGLEVLQNGDDIPPAKRQFVGKMAVSSRELINMTERLLDLSRLQTGRIILQKRFINCRRFAAAQIDLFQTTATKKEITIVNDLPGDMKVYADPDLFGECVKNLLSNALKFCDKGDTITVFNPLDMPSTVAVKDNGPGIAPEKIAALFTAELKTRSLGTAGEKGTGIGLPHTKELMEAHGGTITVESEPAKGATFFLSLPVTYNVTVLVVDDQEVVRMAIREHCAGTFPSILEAGNGVEAMEIIRNVTPHLIITDINMPEMDGLEFIQRVRNDGLARRVPIIAMTSDESLLAPNGMDIRSYCLHIGADDFVNKPVAANDLIPRITRLITSPA